MRALVTGAAGMLGRDLVPCLEREGHAVTAVDVDRMDITDRDAVFSVFRAENPEVVIHAAAYTDVERAERDSETAFRVNAEGAGNVAAACAASGARMIMIGTDFVFDGSGSGPYMESDRPAPLNVYGSSKLRGEELAREVLPGLTVVRTAWLYGGGGENFLTRILRAARGRDSLGVVSDEVGSPTWTADLSGLIARLVVREAAGPLYHAAGAGSCSRFELARELFELLGINEVRLRPVASSSFSSLVRRPSNSALGSECLERDGLSPLRPWRQALADFADVNERVLLRIFRGMDDKQSGES